MSATGATATSATSTRHPFTILIVEDDASDTELILKAVERADLRAIDGEIRLELRATAEGALQLLAERTVDVVLSDLILPGMSGLDLVTRIQQIDRDLPVLIVTRVNDVPAAVEAMRRGAFDYLVKPVHALDLGMRLHRAVRISEIVRRNAAYQRIIQRELAHGTLIGSSAAFREVMRCVHEVAQGRASVLLTGETGTGKGLIARAIHEYSEDRDRPFQVIDCTTVPETMVESELFGHVRGAFTGAVLDKPGLIELANGGTIFLDEISDLPLSMQGKLLRVLEDSEIRPVGGVRTKRVNVRVIAASNQDLQERMRVGTFRKDLYFRLATVEIKVPPLRERPDDIPVIARHLLSRFAREMRKPECFLDSDAMSLLMTYRWPGNVRELRNLIERTVMFAKEACITGSDVRHMLPVPSTTRAMIQVAGSLEEPYIQAKRKVVADFTRAYLQAKLAIHNGVMAKAADGSGIPRQYFSLLMKRFLSTANGRDERTDTFS
ncbi:sigma-54-dependent transcriptional regulator [Candidatus Nitrospira bockiana]